LAREQGNRVVWRYPRQQERRRAPDIPSALIETAFISNPDEERRLNDDAYQNKLADAIVRGVKQYFIKHPPSPKAKLASIA